MKITAHLVVAACIALPGCEVMTPRATPNCTSSPCRVTVTVNSCSSARFSPDDVVVPRVDGKKYVVEWDMASGSTWSFRDPGIEFKGSADRNEFEDEAKGSKKYKWKFKNSKPGKHPYKVHVTDGRQNCTFDPSIMN
jgi:hypothetical protein